MHQQIGLLLFLGAAASAQVINKIEVKTSEDSWSGMDFSTVGLEIFNDNFDVCLIENLDNSGNTFQSGEIDAFTDDELEGCLDFLVPNHGIPLLRLRHWGPDQWIPEYVRVYFDDFVYVECPDGYGIDNNQAHELDCR